MKKIAAFFSDFRVLGLFVAFASVGALAFAYTAQYGFNLQPCILCLYQRKPYFAAGLFGLAAVYFARRRPDASFCFLLLAGLSFLINVGIAGYHTGVEYGWWQGTAACGDANLPSGATLEQLREYLKNRPIVRCDVPAWKMFGISMTGYNYLLSVFLFSFTLFFAARGRLNK